MTTREELQQRDQERKKLIDWIIAITENIQDGELTLGDIEAEKESLENRCYELQELMEKIIQLRLWLDFEESDQRPIF